jgi:hypothetical protein
MTQAHPSTGSPDWDSIDREVCCPLCDFNLKHAGEPRCNECGYTFEWRDVLDPSRRLHHYLFEHHPDKGWRSFWTTVLCGFRPRRFWTTLQAVQPSNRQRLWLFGLIISATIALSGSVSLITTCIQLQRDTLGHRLWLTSPQGADYRNKIVGEYGTLEEAMAMRFSLPPAPRFFADALFYDPIGLLVVWLLLWPWLTFLSLMVFRWSMARAQVKSVHVQRCVVYSYDCGLLAAAPFLCVGAAAAYWGLPTLGSQVREWALLGAALLGLHAVYRLWMAYRHYLRFSHALATVLASQMIVAGCLIAIPLFLSVLLQ